MTKHRKCKHRPFSRPSCFTDNEIQLMSRLCILAQSVGRNSAELTREIVICVCTRRVLQDASVYMVRLLRTDVHDGIDALLDYDSDEMMPGVS